MLFVYNLTGLLFGIIGIVVGVVAWRVTGWLPAFPMGIGLIWVVYGWRKRHPDDPAAFRRAPSFFFIPLRVWGVPLLLLAVPLGFYEPERITRETNPLRQA